MSLTLDLRWGVKKGVKYGLDKFIKTVYKFAVKEVSDILCGRSSAVERQLPKLDVEGSNPFARCLHINSTQ